MWLCGNCKSTLPTAGHGLGQHHKFLYFLWFCNIYAKSHILAGLKICLTKPCCSFFGVNYCHGVTEEASSEAGNTLLIFVLLLYVHPCIQIRRGKVLCVSPAPQSTSAAPLLMRSPSGFSGTFVWVPMRDHGVNLLILKSKKCWEIYG